MNIFTALKKLLVTASPEIKKRVAMFLFILFLFNIIVWFITFLNIKTYPLLFGLVAISYGLGLRHAVDPDHIAAIDNTTRKLLHENKRPVATGFFFSLGHSTVVFILAILVIYSTTFVTNNLPAFQQLGTIIGTIISSIFLFIIGIINVVSLISIYALWKKTKRKKKISNKELHHHLGSRGLLTKILKPFLKTVSSSWHMYPVGLLFGLGFDTASEIALLSISATTSASSIPAYIILLLPLAFTAGMTLIDSLDGILMLVAYGWAYINPERKIYYNLTIVSLSVIAAFAVGAYEALHLIGI